MGGCGWEERVMTRTEGGCGMGKDGLWVWEDSDHWGAEGGVYLEKSRGGDRDG